MWEVGVGRAGESNGGEMGTTVVGQQLKKDLKNKTVNLTCTIHCFLQCCFLARISCTCFKRFIPLLILTRQVEVVLCTAVLCSSNIAHHS